MESFEATIVEAPRGGAYVAVPDEIVAALGGGKRVPVRVTFDGIAYQGSVVSMGSAGMVLGVLKSIRSELDKQPGDTVRVTLEADRSERTVAIPPGLATALADAGMTSAFRQLSYSHQRQCMQRIDEAKKPATRQQRIADTVARLVESSD